MNIEGHLQGDSFFLIINSNNGLILIWQIL